MEKTTPFSDLEGLFNDSVTGYQFNSPEEIEEAFLSEVIKGSTYKSRDLVAVAFGEIDSITRARINAVYFTKRGSQDSGRLELKPKYERLMQRAENVWLLESSLREGIMDKVMKSFKNTFPVFINLGGKDTNILALYYSTRR